MLRYIRIRKQVGGFAQIYQDQDQETIRGVCSDLSGSGTNYVGLLRFIRIRIRKQLGEFAQIFQDQDPDQDQDRETIRWVCSDLSGSGNN